MAVIHRDVAIQLRIVGALHEMTMTDPKSYTRPVVATKRWVEVPNGQLLPYECTAETWYERIEELAKKAGVPVP